MDQGPRVRQEDCLLVGDCIFQRKSFRKHVEPPEIPFILAICDGMGGHPGGKEASRFVCRNMGDNHLRQVTPATVAQLLLDTQRVSEKKLAGNSATTVAGLVVDRSGMMIFNAGDSRVYRLDSGKAVCVSHDHSPVQDMLDRSLISAEEAFLHPYKNLVSLGLGPAFQTNWPDNGAYIKRESPGRDACYLICSDGVSDLLRDTDLASLLKKTPFDNVSILIKTLHQIGLRDNTSFILVQKGFAC